jgi:hypothetical protein
LPHAVKGCHAQRPAASVLPGRLQE